MKVYNNIQMQDRSLDAGGEYEHDQKGIEDLYLSGEAPFKLWWMLVHVAAEHDRSDLRPAYFIVSPPEEDNYDESGQEVTNKGLGCVDDSGFENDSMHEIMIEHSG